VGETLRTAARDAFVHGLHVTLVVSAGLLLMGAVAALRLPREMREDPLVEEAADAGGAERAAGTEDGGSAGTARKAEAMVPSPRERGTKDASARRSRVSA
jgi:DHA2 family multidrug resistance protein-like MFS transporter